MKEIKKFDVLSVAKIYALTLTLITFVIFSLMATIFSLFLPQSPFPFPIGVFVVIGPLVYGFFGFILGLFSAGLYNVFAKYIGGIKIEVKGEETLFSEESGS